jgi:hypothetical protein
MRCRRHCWRAHQPRRLRRHTPRLRACAKAIAKLANAAILSSHDQASGVVISNGHIILFGTAIGLLIQCEVVTNTYHRVQLLHVQTARQKCSKVTTTKLCYFSTGTGRPFSWPHSLQQSQRFEPPPRAGRGACSQVTHRSCRSQQQQT